MSTGHSRMNVTDTDAPSAGFSPSEYLLITENIAEIILSVQKSRQHLDRIIKCIGGAKDSIALRDEA